MQEAVPTDASVSTSLKRPLQDSPLPTAKQQTLSSSCTQPHISPHFTKTTTAGKSAFDLEVAKFFYACNLRFNFADHPQWTKVCSLLRPGYTPPSCKNIAGSLLGSPRGAERRHEGGSEWQNSHPCRGLLVQHPQLIDHSIMSTGGEQCVFL